ncbi:MupG family TIM beta-alpha barrel fold protein [Mycoplasma todarodis]|uniref:DUF871 domain-containing protein n=1 Tax=Mycoplasma todarodis TaxID=1937191 RepID=A0A4R0XLF1_9MOLU|nr:MupG family TIM beta-alpha barrel fold protein [Mycoplasma todarodis]TCG11506.1 hypothetical protein C4B25_01415 [Mycoplasma todarodis]
MKKRIGISIYPNKADIEDTIKYIELAHANGLSRVFANLLEVKQDEEGQRNLSNLKKCLTFARDLGMEVIVDVNPKVYQALNIKPTEYKYFLELGATGIRLDEDFQGEVESILSQNIIVELNASSGPSTMIKTLEKGGIAENLIACHNFYPMEYTGLKFEKFEKWSKWFKEHGVRTAAFITLPREQKNVFGPWDVNDGMPTIEEHRNATLSQQIRHFLAMDTIDDIILSQQGATERQMKEIGEILDLVNEELMFDEIEHLGISQKNFEEFAAIRNKMKPKCIFEVTDIQEVSPTEDFIAFKYLHVNRFDVNDYYIRSSYPRLTFINNIIEPIKITNRKVWKVGDVVVLNKEYGRYAGELHIITKEIPYTGKRNYIGRIKEFDHKILKYVDGGKRYKLIKEK